MQLVMFNLQDYGGVFFMQKNKVTQQNNSFFTCAKNYLRPPFSKNLWLSYCGALIAIYMLLSYFNVSITTLIEIRFGYFALAIAGMIGGPVMGMTVGALGDILKMLMVPGQGSFFFGFTICYAIMGMCYGYIFYKKNITLPRAVAGSLVEFIIAALGNTTCLSILYGTPWLQTFITRLPKCIAMIFVSAILMFIIIRSLNTALHRAQLLGQHS